MSKSLSAPPETPAKRMARVLLGIDIYFGWNLRGAFDSLSPTNPSILRNYLKLDVESVHLRSFHRKTCFAFFEKIGKTGEF